MTSNKPESAIDPTESPSFLFQYWSNALAPQPTAPVDQTTSEDPAKSVAGSSNS